MSIHYFNIFNLLKIWVRILLVLLLIVYTEYLKKRNVPQCIIKIL